jgi:tetratricopeptide (TPR) repeat protein
LTSAQANIEDDELRRVLQNMPKYELLWHAKSVGLKVATRTNHGDIVAKLLAHPDRQALLEHLNRRYPWHQRHAGLITVIGLLGSVITAIGLVVAVAGNSDAELLRKIEALTARLVIAASENVASRGTYDASDPEDRKELARLLQQAAEAQLEDQRIVLGHAALALSEGRYEEALALVPLEETLTDTQDALKAVEHTRKKVDQAIEKNLVRGLALCRKEQWEQAVAHFDRIMELRPGDALARLAAAECLARQERYVAAMAHYSYVISGQARVLDARWPGAMDGPAVLSGALYNRGVIYGLLGEPQHSRITATCSVWSTHQRQCGPLPSATAVILITSFTRRRRRSRTTPRSSKRPARRRGIGPDVC